jgi:hypothetical protein
MGSSSGSSTSRTTNKDAAWHTYKISGSKLTLGDMTFTKYKKPKEEPKKEQ